MKRLVVKSLFLILGGFFASLFFVLLLCALDVFLMKKAWKQQDFEKISHRTQSLQKKAKLLNLMTFSFMNDDFLFVDKICVLVNDGIHLYTVAQQYENYIFSDAEVLPSEPLIFSAQTVHNDLKNMEQFLEEHQTFSTVSEKKGFSKKERTILLSHVEDALALLKLYESIKDEPKQRYIVLLQNHMEIRPTGGFLGSYADISLEFGKLKHVEVQDIYVPDGQMKGYVPPPKPLEKYLLQTGGWKLRDANWEPHYPLSAQSAQWFFDKGGISNVDGIFATNFSVAKNMIDELGPLYLPDYHREITAEELYGFVQVKTEEEFFPGATNKRDVLSAVFRAIQRELPTLSLQKKLNISHKAFQSLHTRDTLFWFQQPNLELQVKKLGWDGGVARMPCETQNCVEDYLYIVETNLGSNKTNCCVERNVEYVINMQHEKIFSSLALQYKNNNPAVPQPPRYFGGGYLNYLRVYKNPEFSLKQQDETQPEFSALREFDGTKVLEYSFPLSIEGGEEKDVVYHFEYTPDVFQTKKEHYKLFIQRQPGMTQSRYTIRFLMPSQSVLSLENTQDLPGAEISSSAGFYELTFLLNRDTELNFSISR